MLPRWYVEQEELPLDAHLTDREIEEWFAHAKFHAASAQEHAERHPSDPAAHAALDRALNELSAAMVPRARRQDERDR